MFIKKITIENAFGFPEKIILDFKQNKKNLASDFASGFFLERDSEIISPLVAIAGRNASGKTSLLKSINHVLSFFSENSISISNNVEFRKYFNNSDKINDLFYLGKIDSSSIYKLFLNKSFEKFFDVKDFFNQKKVINDLLINSSNSNDGKNNNLIDNKIIDNISNEIFNEKLKLFKSIKNKEDTPTKIEIHFYDKECGLFSLLYSDFILDNNIVNFDFKLLSDNKTDISIILKKLVEYSNSYFYAQSQSELLSFGNTNINWINNGREIFKKLSLTFNEKDIIKIINICDETIVDISFYDQINNTNKDRILKSLFNNKKQELKYDQLSDGTKKFLYLFSNIAYRISINESVLIIADEIDNFLHNEIVNFIKSFILFSSKSKDVQLIFTSHNPQTLTSYISTKQIYMLETKPKKDVFKVAKKINKNNSALKMIIEKKIGEHPSDITIIDTCLDLYEKCFRK